MSGIFSGTGLHVQDCNGVMVCKANAQDVLDARREYLEALWRWVRLYRRTKLGAYCEENHRRCQAL